MQKELYDKGILLPSGNINKNKINLISGAIVLPFAEMVWATSRGDMEAVNRLAGVLVSMNTPVYRGRLFRVIQMLYALLGLKFSDEVAPIATHTGALKYFIFSFITDFGEIIKDYIVDVRISATEREDTNLLCD